MLTAMFRTCEAKVWSRTAKALMPPAEQVQEDIDSANRKVPDLETKRLIRRSR